MPRRTEPPFVPNPEQMALWPEVSGNAVNGLGEKAVLDKLARRRVSRGQAREE